MRYLVGLLFALTLCSCNHLGKQSPELQVSTQQDIDQQIPEPLRGNPFYIGWWKINPDKSYELMYKKGLLDEQSLRGFVTMPTLAIYAKCYDYQFTLNLNVNKRHRGTVNTCESLTQHIAKFDLISNDGLTADFTCRQIIKNNGKESFRYIFLSTTRVDSEQMIFDMRVKQVGLPEHNEVLVFERLKDKRGKMPEHKKAKGKFFSKASGTNQKSNTTVSKP